MKFWKILRKSHSGILWFFRYSNFLEYMIVLICLLLSTFSFKLHNNVFIYLHCWLNMIQFKSRKEVHIILISETTFVSCLSEILNHHILFFICTSWFLSYTINFVVDLNNLNIYWLCSDFLFPVKIFLYYILLCVLVPSCWHLEPWMLE